MGGAHHALGLGDAAQGADNSQGRPSDGEGRVEGGHADDSGKAIAFQPLRHIDRAADRAWAAEWIGALLAHEKLLGTPEIKEAIWSALTRLATTPVEERSIPGLSLLLQDRKSGVEGKRVSVCVDIG